jgi:hypothetical protein
MKLMKIRSIIRKTYNHYTLFYTLFVVSNIPYYTVFRKERGHIYIFFILNKASKILSYIREVMIKAYKNVYTDYKQRIRTYKTSIRTYYRYILFLNTSFTTFYDVCNIQGGIKHD